MIAPSVNAVFSMCPLVIDAMSLASGVVRY